MIPQYAHKRKIPIKAPFGMTKNYYLLLSGYFISSIGDWFYRMALPLLVYEITGSAMSMAVTYGLTYLPYVIFSPFGGVAADRINRQRLLVIGDFLSAIVVGLLAIAVWLHVKKVWIIYSAVFILAGVEPFYHPAFQSLVPSLVSDPQLPKANAWLNGAENLITLAGPLLGGVFIATIGTKSVLLLDAVSFLVSALLLAAIRIRKTEKQQGLKTASVLGEVREGLQYVWENPVIRYGSLLFLGTNFAITIFQANYVYFLTQVLGSTPTQLGLGFAIPGIGAIFGALVAPKLGKQFQAGTLILGSTVTAGFFTLPLFVAKDAISVAISWAIVTTLGTINAITWFTLRQRVVPQHLLGRVIALTRLVAFAAIPIAASIGGLIMSATQNIYLIIALAAVIRIAVGGIGFFTPLHQKTAQ
jgi:MFS family permease